MTKKPLFFHLKGQDGEGQWRAESEEISLDCLGDSGASFVLSLTPDRLPRSSISFPGLTALIITQ